MKNAVFESSEQAFKYIRITVTYDVMYSIIYISLSIHWIIVGGDVFLQFTVIALRKYKHHRNIVTTANIPGLLDRPRIHDPQ